jgi:hypothetical protein
MALDTVGSVYEIGLNEQGYMLADTPARPVTRQGGILDSQPPGSDAPLNERIGRYDFVGQVDWTGGEGQEMADRPASDTTRYWYSEGVDPFTTPGQLTCLPTVPRQLTDTYANLEMAVAGTNLLVRTADDEYKVIDSAGSATTVATTVVSTKVKMSLASDGVNWYITDGSDIHRGTFGAVGAAWSTENVDLIAWCSDRLMGADNTASPEELISFSPAGVGTVATTARVGETINSICGGDGYVWYGATQDGASAGSYVGYWQVDSSPTNVGTAITLPPNEFVTTLFYYLGNVFIGVLNYTGPNFEAKVYRCVPSEGVLTPQLLADGLNAFVHPRFAGAGKYVAVTSGSMNLDSDAGLMVIDLETGGYARWHTTNAAQSGFEQMYVVNWLGDFAVSLDTDGVWGRDSGDFSSPTYVTGFFITSTGDLGTPALKFLDEVLVSSTPLPASTTIRADYSTDGGSTWTTAVTSSTTGATRAAATLSTSVTSSAYRFMVVLTPSAATKPTLTGVLAKTHTTGIVDEIVTLPINCEDTVANVHGTTIAADSGPGKGMERYRTLRALLGTKVTFQDVDYQMTDDASLWEVIGVDSTLVNVFNQLRNLNDQTAHVAVVTLRRPYSA